jgi:hypothetical protein
MLPKTSTLNAECLDARALQLTISADGVFFQRDDLSIKITFMLDAHQYAKQIILIIIKLIIIQLKPWCAQMLKLVEFNTLVCS